MKHIILISILFAFYSCENKLDENDLKSEPKIIHFDTFYFDTNEINGSGGQPYKEYHLCRFEKFLIDKKVPKFAKDIYLDSNWNLSNDKEALSLLDSLNAKIINVRPFYLKVITITYEKADGYFSEALGLAGKQYVEKNTKEFISNFDNKECFTKEDLETWTEIVLLEIKLNEEFSMAELNIYIKTLKLNCISCSPAQIENLNTFCSTLKEKWIEFAKR